MFSSGRRGILFVSGSGNDVSEGGAGQSAPAHPGDIVIQSLQIGRGNVSRVGGGARMLGEQLDHCPVEGRDVVGLAAGDQRAVDDARLVGPVGAGVPEACSDGHEVMRRPSTPPAFIRVHGP